MHNSQILSSFVTAQNDASTNAVKEKFITIYETDLTTVLNGIVEDIDFMTKFLDKGIKHNDYSKFKRTPVTIAEMVRYLDNLNDKNYKFKIHKTFSDDSLLTIGMYNPETGKDEPLGEDYYAQDEDQFHSDSKENLTKNNDMYFKWPWDLFEVLVK